MKMKFCSQHYLLALINSKTAMYNVHCTYNIFGYGKLTF